MVDVARQPHRIESHTHIPIPLTFAITINLDRLRLDFQSQPLYIVLKRGDIILRRFNAVNNDPDDLPGIELL